MFAEKQLFLSDHIDDHAAFTEAERRFERVCETGCYPFFYNDTVDDDFNRMLFILFELDVF